MRRSVEEQVACGVPHEQIAMSFSISRETLYKYFQDNLEHGKARKRRELYAWIFKSAQKGNIGAQRKLVELVEAGLVAQDMLDRADDRKRAEDVEPKEPKLGKKDQALKDAKEPDLSTTLGELMAMRQRGGTAVN